MGTEERREEGKSVGTAEDQRAAAGPRAGSVTAVGVGAGRGAGTGGTSAPGALLALLRLALLPGVGRAIHDALLERFGSVRAALRASRRALCGVPGVGPRRAAAIERAARGRGAEAELDRAARAGVALLGLGLPGYPSALAALPDAPLVLWMRGELREDAARVAIIGSRRATPYALRMARELASGFARAGGTVVSGLARGVDGAAHRACLEAGGRTVAVLGSGVDVIYPPEHARLYEAASAQGAVLSELPLGTPPRPGHFPRRNRVIAGLSRAVVVVQATRRSGSLTTASWALDQGRQVLAVPHRIGDPGAEGVLKLLRDGAQPALSAGDVALAAGLDTRAVEESESTDALAAASGGAAPAAPRGGRLSTVEAAVLRSLSDDPLDLDAIARAAKLPLTSAFQALLDLEGRGQVALCTGQTFVRG